MTENLGGGGGDFLASLPADVQSHGSLKNFSGADGGVKLARSFIEAQGVISSRSMADMNVPSDEAGIRAVMTKLGRVAPDTPDGYDLAERPNTAAFRALAHKHGLTVQTAKAMFDEIGVTQDQITADRKTRDDKFRTDSETSLRSEWGAEYDANLELSQRGAENAFGEEFRNLLKTTGLDQHPEMQKLLHSRGMQMKEGTFRAAGGAGSGTATTVDTATAALNKFNTENWDLIMSQNDELPGVLEAKKQRNVLNANLAKMKVQAREDASVALGSGV